jgi:hypothetical protein
MGHAFHQLYYHFAWATHSRIALIHRSYRADLLKNVARKIRPLKGANGKRKGGLDLSNPRHEMPGLEKRDEWRNLSTIDIGTNNEIKCLAANKENDKGT